MGEGAAQPGLVIAQLVLGERQFPLCSVTFTLIALGQAVECVEHGAGAAMIGVDRSSAMLAYARVLSGSMLPSMLMHFAHNAFVVYLELMRA